MQIKISGQMQILQNKDKIVTKKHMKKQLPVKGLGDHGPYFMAGSGRLDACSEPVISVVDTRPAPPFLPAFKRRLGRLDDHSAGCNVLEVMTGLSGETKKPRGGDQMKVSIMPFPLTSTPPVASHL